MAAISEGGFPEPGRVEGPELQQQQAPLAKAMSYKDAAMRGSGGGVITPEPAAPMVEGQSVKKEANREAPPASVAHLAAALREAAAEPGATLRYPTPPDISDEQVFRGPPGVPLTPANAAADPATHHLIVAPGPKPGQVDVLEQVDIPPLAGEDIATSKAAATALEQAREPQPAIGPSPLRDPLAEHGNSDEGEDEGEETSGGALDALSAAASAMGLGGSASGQAGGVVDTVRGKMDEYAGTIREKSSGASEAIRHQAGGVVAAVREKAAGMVDTLRGSVDQARQTTRDMGSAVAAGATMVKEKLTGSVAGAKVSGGGAQPLLGDVILGGGGSNRDQEQKAEELGRDWTSGPAP